MGGGYVRQNDPQKIFQNSPSPSFLVHKTGSLSVISDKHLFQQTDTE